MSQLDVLADELLGKAVGRRFLLGVTGPPGSGKSTFAKQLVEQCVRRGSFSSPVLVPMDGFHLPNAELDRRGLRPVKGSPQTYDVDALVRLLRQLRDESKTHAAPLYSRELHEPVPDTIRIEPQASLIVIEGNYLLLGDPPWDVVRPLLDEVWYLDVPCEVCMARVHARHIRGGCTAAQASRKVGANDRPNYLTIAATRHRADRVIAT